jgi:acetolactate decarboxylase
MTKSIVGLSMALVLVACTATEENAQSPQHTYSDVLVAGAMKNVMWKGELAGIIDLDTIQDKKGLYGLGPLSDLTGELLINDGKSYVSKVLTDSTMSVEETFDLTAPFFVYGHVNEWEEMGLPDTIREIADLEQFIDEKTKDRKRPFVFKLSGQIAGGIIHVQNLPKGTKVSSPKEAHQGQVDYKLGKEEVDIVGFFSTTHQGIFTHHDSYLHMHLITKEESLMGHLDEVEFTDMSLFLPVR